MKEYWLTLFPDTFLWIQEEQGCIYNTLNFHQIRFTMTEDLRKMLVPLLELDNLYQVTVNEEEVRTPEIKSLIDSIVETESGSLVLNDGSQECPVSIFPELRIRDDMEDYKWEHGRHIDGKVIHNLHRLVFYINGSDFGSEIYARQTVYPVASAQKLDIEDICAFVANGNKSLFLREVALVGNLWEYPDYSQLLNRLAEMGFQVSVYMTARDVLADPEEAYGWEQKGISFHILLAGKIDEQIFRRKNVPENENYTFIIAEEDEYEQATDYIEQYQLKQANVLPVYTGDNLPFFQENVYLTEEELAGITLSKREIFIRQALNIYFFGTLSVLPDGKIYGNLNLLPVGDITEAPHDVVYREMTEGNAWFRVRNQEPCKNCVNQWLCPSPSNYEWVIGKPDLCYKNNH